MVAFYLQASDAAASPMTGNFPNDAPNRECLVRVGEVQPTGNFPLYRIWMTQSTLNTWNSRYKLDNSSLDVTFVLGTNASFMTRRHATRGVPTSRLAIAALPAADADTTSPSLPTTCF